MKNKINIIILTLLTITQTITKAADIEPRELTLEYQRGALIIKVDDRLSIRASRKEDALSITSNKRDHKNEEKLIIAANVLTKLIVSGLVCELNDNLDRSKAEGLPIPHECRELALEVALKIQQACSAPEPMAAAAPVAAPVKKWIKTVTRKGWTARLEK